MAPEIHPQPNIFPAAPSRPPIPMSRRTPCNFHQRPGGCRKGADCNFLHTGPPGGFLERGLSGSSTAPPGHRGTNQPPHGVCREFWASGQCRRHFDCRYKHEWGTHSRDKTDGASHPLSLTTRGSSTPKGLNPTEVHNHLKTFLRDGYRFKTSNEIYAFVRLLGSATKDNDWNVEDGQLLLAALATVGNNGLLRLGDIIRHTEVGINAGTSPCTLSFQGAYLPLLAYLSSEFVVKSTMNHNVNALYTLIHNDFEVFAKTLQTSMDGLMAAKSFRDPLARNIGTSKEILAVGYFLLCLLYSSSKYLTRFRHAATTHPTLIALVHSLGDWLDDWISGINSTPPTFEDVWANQGTLESRLFITRHLRGEVGRVLTIVDRELATQKRNEHYASKRTHIGLNNPADIGILAYLETGYVGPGEERQEGPRHDNDFADILQIRIAPTHDELICAHPPFLPANIPNAPHHLPAGSMEKLLDIQFRLLREELIAPLRRGVQLILQDLDTPSGNKTMLSTLLGKRGGRYVGNSETQDNIMFNVYTNCRFSLFQLHPYRGITVQMTLDAPPGSARSGKAAVRSHFWDGKGGKRLMQGGLVALVWNTGRDTSVYLGTVASSLKELAASAKQSQEERVQLQVSFFDPQAELRILQAIKNPDGALGLKLLIEAPVMFETIRPFLDALRAEPTSLPFNRYLVHPLSGSMGATEIKPPKYATNPGFTFDLRCLFKSEPPETLRLSVMEHSAVNICRQELRTENSRLDPSQADAVIDALTREVALIQGPPGTGKTYIGVEILRVLKTNGIGPVLMIAYTNHALDHMLSSVLDADITKNIVRLGARSSDERISQFNLDDLEMLQGKSRLDRTLGVEFKILKETQKEMDTLMSSVRQAAVTGAQIEDFLEIQYADQYASLHAPSDWVAALQEKIPQGSDWESVGAVRQDNSLFSFWEDGRDLNFLAAQAMKPEARPVDVATTNRYGALSVDVPLSAESDDGIEATPDTSRILPEMGFAASWLQTWGTTDESSEHELRADQEPRGSLEAPEQTVSHSFFTRFGINSTPEIPTTDRPLPQLLEPSSWLNMWEVSEKERACLARYWRDEVRRFSAEKQLGQFSRLRSSYEGARGRYNEIKDQSKIRLLRDIDIVGCTTTGAAKLNALLKSFSPKVLLVEEAGQVLEAHVLGSLVPSVDHLILIGDPLQLRPNLANYNLSVDSKLGKILYRFDMSLMERLSSSGLQMSQLEIQRRMRPSIANLVRQSLYPRLQDHELTKAYPSVRGMAKDVFFMSHEHRETGGGEDSVSKHNMFEVKMTVDLVLHFLRQGSYSDDGDIVVLCAYLGQLVRMRDAFSGKVVTVIDERDQEMLAAHEPEEEREEPGGPSIGLVSVTRKVLLRTVDNFQGEEAKITILSLVRNAGSIEDRQKRAASVLRPSIGFLKSRNRTNVALSRAQHGLYIMGNAANLASQSPMWKTVIDVLDEQGSLGSAFPICCPKHPDERHDISAPGILPQYAPDGGCLRSCAEPLRCGHVCPYKCHSDDTHHTSVLCSQHCLRLCPQGHPCDKLCSQTCGNCQHPVLNVPLPCGHISPSVPCHLASNLGQIKCYEVVVKSLSTCEHTLNIACGEDITFHKCQVGCGINLVCCGRPCASTCGDCQSLNDLRIPDTSTIPRNLHVGHSCRKNLFCSHPCKSNCSEDHTCTIRCLQSCRQSCEHASCKQPCYVVCAPCAEPCSWACPHQGICPVPCGSICARLPCDVRCSEILPCGHQCPSLCGEPCSICILCAPMERKTDIVDLVMHTTLEDIVPGESLDSLLLTLSCGHTFTVETLDGVCELGQFYRRSSDSLGRWFGLATPNPGFRSIPVCPSCRAPISIPRYGRAIKRGKLDLAERNVASDMSCSLQELRGILEGFDQAKAQADMVQSVDDTAGAVALTKTAIDEIRRSHQKQLQNSRNKPAALQCYNLAKKNMHKVSSSGATTWRTVARPLIRAYTLAIDVASRRPAHIVAYENAFSTLYRRELEELTNDPTHTPRMPTENAMRIARFNVGQPPPRADKRFTVEALWLSLKLRFLMGDLAEARLNAMNKAATNSSSERFVWAGFVRFIYLSCYQDAKLALEIAVGSESHRQAVTSRRLELRAGFEIFRFDVDMWKRQSHSQEERQKLLEETRKTAREARHLVQSTRESYLSSRQGASEREWIFSNLTEPAYKIMDQWEALESSIRTGTFYDPVSLDETTQIVQAMGFSHTGHWYTCSNGHIYVIGECGGAVEVASCPECGSAIGGTNHTLNSNNTRAIGMEDIGRRQGAEASPWRWAQGA